MSNRFHTKSNSSPREISPEEMEAFLHPNNTNTTHTASWDTPQKSAKQSKKDILIARRENIRTAYATDHSKEVNK